MTRRIDYVLMDPTGNITILAETPAVPADQPAIAARLMAAEPSAEQVGFLSAGPGGGTALRMAGGEFCGNAAMSAAALYAEREGLSHSRIRVCFAGMKEPAEVEITALPDGWQGTVSMPRPLSVAEEAFPGGGIRPVVRFDGISHVILESDQDPAELEALAPLWCRHLGAEAVGLMLLDTAEERLTPLVYVPAAGTLCWENSCASGTSAAGAYLARKAGRPVTLSLRQPGGSLEVSASPDGALYLTGTVRLRKRGKADIEL
jgi:diaminopimelate epimerase